MLPNSNTKPETFYVFVCENMYIAKIKGNLVFAMFLMIKSYLLKKKIKS